MDLDGWMTAEGKSSTDVGGVLSVDPVTVRQWRRKASQPRKRRMPSIWLMTGGQVTPRDMGRPQWQEWCEAEVAKIIAAAAKGIPADGKAGDGPAFPGRSPYDGKPYYCDVCGLGFGEFVACEEPECRLETAAAAAGRAAKHQAAE